MPLVSDDPWVVRHDLAGGISQKVKKVVDGSAALSFFPVLASSMILSLLLCPNTTDDAQLLVRLQDGYDSGVLVARSGESHRLG